MTGDEVDNLLMLSLAPPFDIDGRTEGDAHGA